MAEQDADILKTIAETVNGLGDYLRKQAEKNPESSWAEMQNLPQPIDLPTTDHSATTPEVEEVVIPLPRRPLYDEGYMLPEEGVFPVTLTVTAGTATDTGDATTQCGYEYDVEDAITSEKLAGTGTDPAVNAVDPTAGVHKWVRPAVGYMLAATYGYGHRNEDGALVIGWINEIAEQEACGGEEGNTYDQGSY